MSDDVFILGAFSTPAGRFFGQSPKELVRAAYLGVLGDARIDGGAIGHIWFSNMLLDFWGQPNVKGQVCLLPPLSPTRFARGASRGTFGERVLIWDFGFSR